MNVFPFVLKLANLTLKWRIQLFLTSFCNHKKNKQKTKKQQHVYQNILHGNGIWEVFNTEIASNT